MKFKVLCIPALMLTYNILSAQSVDTLMTVDFQFTTSSPGGTYSPRNIGAIWVEDESGNFVQTLKRWANNRRQYLYTWNARTGGNVVDAVTGATRSNHGTHSVAWDFTNFSGDTLDAGNYVLWIEMTDRHAQGPLTSFTFPFMGATETISPPDQSYFYGMQMIYDLTVIVALDPASRQLPQRHMLYQNHPNPFNPATLIHYALPIDSELELQIYDVQGRTVRILKQGMQSAGVHSYLWDGRADSGEMMETGVYICHLKVNDEIQAIKMALVK